MSKTYRTLDVAGPQDLVFGRAPRPVRCGLDLVIGEGVVFPEVNFTLPAIEVNSQNWPAIVEHYHEMADNILKRAVALAVPGIVLEFELLPPMTENPEWGAELTALLHGHLLEAREKSGLRSALRVTPTDIREQGKPPLLRSGAPWAQLKQSFERCIQEGADIVSIESIGGKEVHDPALMYGDLQAMVFALGVLAPRDMRWLWREIDGLCAAAGGTAVPGGDSACGFANTAMQLAHQKMLPEVLAAVVRAMSAVRSLVAFENGAVGPSKDCAYEGPVIKAITGCSISMEGKSASCAHFSPIGNIASAMCDLWSNESVQNVRLLSGSAPEAFTELLAYDCRLMNAATAKGQAITLRDLMVESDEWLSPQAAVLSPAATCRIAQAIVDAEGNYRRTIAAGQAAVSILSEGLAAGKLHLSAKECQWLERIGRELAEMPESEEELLGSFLTSGSYCFDPASYGIEVG
jgi:methanol--5-hydroxybenzimidazolylcobamide Co-methyltransferase